MFKPSQGRCFIEMKKMIFWSLLGIVFVITLFFHEQSISEKREVEQVTEGVENLEEVEGERFSGYYYHDYLDRREKGGIEFEREYFRYMNRHFKDYLGPGRLLSKGNKDEETEDYLAYFESIGGLELYSFPRGGVDLNNGDYITFIVKSLILESDPAQIQKVEDIEVLYEF